MTVTKPIILCLHGGGTSGAIFHAQLRNVQSRLKGQFDFVFVNAPREGPAGPGVLPLFADSGPYHWWFGAGWRRGRMPGTMTEPQDEVAGAIDMEKSVIARLAQQGRKPEDISGIMGFSEGCLALSLVLWRLSMSSRPDYIGQPSPWSKLNFAVLMCSGYRGDVAQMVGLGNISVPSVHLHGLEDPLLFGSREMLLCYQDDNSTRLIEFDGAHHVPSAAADLDKFTTAILDAARRGQRWSANRARLAKPAIAQKKKSTAPQKNTVVYGRFAASIPLRKEANISVVVRSVKT